MIKEEILLTTSKTGTTAFYFVAGVDNSIVPFLEEPAYVTFNGLGIPDTYKIYSSGITELWTLNNSNGYLSNVLLSSVTTNFVTGYSYSDTFKKVLSPIEKQAIQDRFYNNVIATISGQTNLPPTFQTYVFFNEHEVDDMYANIKLSRTYETLDTLSIYNKPINSIPQQEAVTGVLFGKLQAIQILKDEVGNNIRIPLRNVPVGIFNPTPEFQAPMSLDDNGDRFFMNILESTNQSQYFNTESFTSDTRYLKSQNQFLSVPEKFKYITTTNENGEFVIYNAPIGSQTLVFEVDLFKQGLTKDEIILNNFPFPTNDDSNIGELPCYYYNQVPVDIVPTWGNSQSGYTEVNVNVNLDLRKWATYIFPPASFGNEKLETTVAKNIANTFKIQVRDMTNKEFAPKPLEIVQIPNDLDRADGSKYLWYNELLSQRQQVEFFKYGCHVMKLPANLYDPNGYKTDVNGVANGSRGVWLAAYQFSVFVNKNRSVRNTGGASSDYPLLSTSSFWSHFDLNFVNGATPTDLPGSGIGRFPYEKPWTINYPEPYKIPTKPAIKRFDYGGNRRYQSPYIVEEPAYEDGDLVGNEVYTPDEIAGGFGVQSFNGVWFPNQISYVATKNYMYKYERDVYWNERYANGYEPFWDSNNLGPYASYSDLAGMSKVVNGEKYQRVECGYGYFMKYHDWPRVFRESWAADIYFYPDTGGPGYSSSGNYGSFKALSGWRHLAHNIDDQNYAFAFEQFLFNKKSVGGIDIYRIVESGLGNIKVPENFIIPTYARLNYGGQADRLSSLYVKNTGSIDAKLRNDFNSGTVIVIQNPSGGSISFGTSSTFTLNPGGRFSVINSVGGGSVELENEVKFTGMNFPGNDNFNSSTNKYETCNYVVGITVGNGNIDGAGNVPTDTGHVDLSFNVAATTSTPEWYINTSNTGTHDDSNPDRQGVSSFGLRPQYHSLYSLYIETSPR